jgi:hypothetical protein
VIFHDIPLEVKPVEHEADYSSPSVVEIKILGF